MERGGGWVVEIEVFGLEGELGWWRLCGSDVQCVSGVWEEISSGM